MGPAFVLPLLLLPLLLLGPSLVPGTGGRNTPPAPRHFLEQEKFECRFSNGTGQPRVRFFYRSIYDRQEYVRFDSDRGEFVVVAPLGEPDAKYWNSRKDILQDYRRYVDSFCRHNYEIAGTFAHARRVRPTVTISPTKEDPLSPHTLLFCTVASFYPLEIEIKWLKNGQEEKKGVLYGEELRNGDWTYQTQVMLETMPEHGDVYTCRVEHASLKTPIAVQWEPRRSDSAQSKVWTGVVGFVLGAVFVAVGLSLYLKSKKATHLQQPAALIG